MTAPEDLADLAKRMRAERPPASLRRRVWSVVLAATILLTLGALTFAMMRSGQSPSQEGPPPPALERVEDRYPVSLATPHAVAPARPLLSIEEHQSLYAD